MAQFTKILENLWNETEKKADGDLEKKRIIFNNLVAEKVETLKEFGNSYYSFECEARDFLNFHLKEDCRIQDAFKQAMTESEKRY